MKPSIKCEIEKIAWDPETDSIVGTGEYFVFLNTLKSQTFTILANPVLNFLPKEKRFNIGIGVGFGVMFKVKTVEIEYEDDEIVNKYKQNSNQFNLPIATNLLLKYKLSDKFFITLNNSISLELLELNVNEGEGDIALISENGGIEKESFFKSKIGINFIF